jgi:hypothetical protein
VSTIAEGMMINENPVTTLSVNGVAHNLTLTYVTFPGAHRLPDFQLPCDAELFCWFQHSTTPQVYVCLTLPLVVGASNPYFATLGTVTANRPTLSTLFDPATVFLSYRGASLQGRSAADPRPRTKCDPPSLVTYYVATKPTTIATADYQRLQGKDRPGPPKPVADIIQARLVKLGTLVKGITISGSESDSQAGTSAKAMKCYRLEDKDVVGDRVYVGGKGRPGRSLSQELEKAASDMTTPEPGGVKPGDIENILGIVIGVLLGLVLCSAAAYYIWNSVFGHYVKAQELYASSSSALPKTLP